MSTQPEALLSEARQLAGVLDAAGLRRAGEMLRVLSDAIERKDALLRQALEAMRLAVDDDYLLAAVRSTVAITKELK